MIHFSPSCKGIVMAARTDNSEPGMSIKRPRTPSTTLTSVGSSCPRLVYRAGEMNGVDRERCRWLCSDYLIGRANQRRVPHSMGYHYKLQSQTNRHGTIAIAALRQIKLEHDKQGHKSTVSSIYYTSKSTKEGEMTRGMAREKFKVRNGRKTKD